MRFERFTLEFDRRKISILLGGVCLFIIFLWIGNAAFKNYTGQKRAVSVKKSELEELRILKEEYLKKKVGFDYLEKRLLSPKGSDSPIRILEDIGRKIGIKEKITALKPLEERTIRGYMERGVEMRIDGMDINQLINLLYRIENHSALLIIKEFSMKNRFDNPDLMDITINTSLINRAG